MGVYVSSADLAAHRGLEGPQLCGPVDGYGGSFESTWGIHREEG